MLWKVNVNEVFPFQYDDISGADPENSEREDRVPSHPE